jgi:hypothetical protein
VDNDGVWDDAEPYQDLNGNGGYDPGEPFTDENGNLVWDDAEFYDPDITGYKVPDDIGDTVTFRLQDATAALGMFWYYTVCYGPINTGDPVFTGTVSVSRWISGECEPFIVSIGDWLQVEPGNFSNPTSKALDILWEQDPDAYWDEATSTVVSPYGNKSPRIIKAPAFDPTLGLRSDATGRKYLTVSRILVLFLDEPHEIVGSADLLLKGRFMKTLTEGVPDPNGCSGGGMLAIPLLVK